MPSGVRRSLSKISDSGQVVGLRSVRKAALSLSGASGVGQAAVPELFDPQPLGQPFDAAEMVGMPVRGHGMVEVVEGFATSFKTCSIRLRSAVLKASPARVQENRFAFGGDHQASRATEHVDEVDVEIARRPIRPEQDSNAPAPCRCFRSQDRIGFSPACEDYGHAKTVRLIMGRDGLASRPGGPDAQERPGIERARSRHDRAVPVRIQASPPERCETKDGFRPRTLFLSPRGRHRPGR